jgi:hypothetical protein
MIASSHTFNYAAPDQSSRPKQYLSISDVRGILLSIEYKLSTAQAKGIPKNTKNKGDCSSHNHPIHKVLDILSGRQDLNLRPTAPKAVKGVIFVVHPTFFLLPEILIVLRKPY